MKNEKNDLVNIEIQTFDNRLFSKINISSKTLHVKNSNSSSNKISEHSSSQSKLNNSVTDCNPTSVNLINENHLRENEENKSNYDDEY